MEALAIGETSENIEKIDLEQNFVTFSDLESVLKGISNISTMNNTSHITQLLPDKIERLESQGEKEQYYLITGHCGVEVNETADLEAKKGRESQLLLPVANLKFRGKRKEKRNLKLSVKTPTGTGEKATLKGTAGMNRLRGSVT